MPFRYFIWFPNDFSKVSESLDNVPDVTFKCHNVWFKRKTNIHFSRFSSVIVNLNIVICTCLVVLFSQIQVFYLLPNYLLKVLVYSALVNTTSPRGDQTPVSWKETRLVLEVTRRQSVGRRLVLEVTRRQSVGRRLFLEVTRRQSVGRKPDYS